MDLFQSIDGELFVFHTGMEPSHLDRHIRIERYTACLLYTSRCVYETVVGLIGFMNMANTMIMNITTKKQEYGVDVYKRQAGERPSNIDHAIKSAYDVACEI